MQALNRLMHMLNFFKRIRPSSFYVFAAVLFELLFNWTTSPLQAPDEFNHFYRAYQISQGYFLPQQKDKRLGGDIPYDITDFTAPFKMESWVPMFKPSRSGHSDSFPNAVSDATIFKDFPNTAYYSPVSYLPQAFIMSVLNIFHADPAVLYYAGRIFTFLISLLVMWYVIKIMPVYQWLFAVLALLPMNMFVVNSFSADTVTNLLSFLFIALVFKNACSAEKLTQRTLIYFCLIAALLALAKLVYAALIVLIFIIPAQRFSSRKQRTSFIILLFAATLVMTALWSWVLADRYLSYQSYNPAYRDSSTISGLADYGTQRAYIFNHPTYFPKVIINSIFNADQTYLKSYIGQFGAFFDVPMPFYIIVISYIIILVITLGEKNEFTFTVKQKIFMFLAPFISFVLLLLSQHLTWDPIGCGKVELIQGRYLIPLVPLWLIVLGSSFKKIKFNVRPSSVLFILVLNLFATGILYERYLYEPFNEVTQFTCDAEQMNASGNYKTSSPDFVLQGSYNQSEVEKRNGKFSAMLSQTSPYCFTYVFKRLSDGDIVDISCWKKGEATLCMSDQKKECGSFYNEFDDVHYTDRNGWVNLHAIFKISTPCDTINLAFFMRNKNNQSAYVDDLTFTIKKKKKK